ncbi:MAG: chemotaxis-specific protein-glutamate methyltransferase CheB [Deltaproteobacteria bacterium]|nr:chemotaxis-specific protein-glutamate methyltransferase CheB [Deltaproteobacteria bacterium]
MKHSDRPVRVLVVDDSTMARDMIIAVLSSAPGITVVGKASNGLEAVAKVAALKPDLVTMDIEMPLLGGLEAIERIMAEHPVPILVVTARGGVHMAFAAVSKGALDLIEKPDIDPKSGQELIRKVRLLAGVDITRHQAVRARTEKMARTPLAAGQPRPDGRIVAIAASTGGPQALQQILSRLPADFPAPIVISQHIADGFAQGMADWLNCSTPLKVSVARNNEQIRPGCVYVNPSEFSMRITGQGATILGGQEACRHYHPCCDTLLRSAADAYGAHGVGVILSGMGDDGVDGMRAIKTAGGTTLAQDAKSSVVYGMNRLAVERGYVNRVVALADIASELAVLVGGTRERGGQSDDRA